MCFSIKKVAFFTLGCKLNFAESSTILRYFIEKNYSLVDFKEIADVYVINSCSVTGNAEKKSRNAISRAKSKNADAVIIFTGCYAQFNQNDLLKLGIDYIIGANDKDKIYEIIDNIEKKTNPFTISTNRNETKRFVPAFSQGGRTRSFLKIQDGCDYFCSYCAIPFARGKNRSATIEEIIPQAQHIADFGIKEIVLTGINIGEFGKNNDENLFELLKEIIKIDRIERFRISSIEPNLLSDEIIKLTADNQKIMPHFHIPLQSGCDEMLRLMNRRYDTDFFKNKIEKIKSFIPNAFIGIDLIVGVNGESDNYFQKTLDFVKSLNISFIHQFQYSERPGTKALNFSPKISPQEKQERADLINEISQKKHFEFLNNNIGKTTDVLFESTKKTNKMFGFTDNYIKTEIDFDEKNVNKIIKVKLIEFSENKQVLKGQTDERVSMER